MTRDRGERTLPLRMRPAAERLVRLAAQPAARPARCTLDLSGE
jgi:hypothetical protein